MTQQAELHKQIDSLPPQFFGEVIEFLGYLQYKAKHTMEQNILREQRNTRDKELINMHAEELNKEAEEAFEYQKWFWEVEDSEK